MKTLVILVICLISVNLFSQGFTFGTKERFNVTLAFDPSATSQEQSPNVVTEIEYEHSFMYIKAGMQFLPALEGGYYDCAGAVGVNFTKGYFQKTRYYTGIRLGHIWRGQNGYPLFGFESGVDYYFDDTIFVGVRTTQDNREDYLYSGAEPKFRISNFIRVGYVFKNKN